MYILLAIWMDRWMDGKHFSQQREGAHSLCLFYIVDVATACLFGGTTVVTTERVEANIVVVVDERRGR